MCRTQWLPYISEQIVVALLPPAMGFVVGTFVVAQVWRLLGRRQ
ncbi:MAG: hypothetical protein R3C44_19625 [Chloroflexota bacterium]